MTTISEALQGVAAYRQSGNLAEAERLCRQILATDPRHAEAFYHFGCILKDQRRFADALRSFHQAVTLQPRLAEAFFEAATIYHGASRSRQDAADRRRDEDAAENAYRAAIGARPDYFEAYNNLGALCRNQGNVDQAIACYQKVRELRPDFVEVHNNLGLAYLLQGNVDQAVQCFDETLRHRPDDAETHYNRVFAMLSIGRFAEGWPEFEWRWQCGTAQPHGHAHPEWDGGPLAGRLLIHAEQGLGDVLQFVRYVPLVVARGIDAVVEVHPPLVPLLRQSGVSGVVAQGEPLPPCEARIPMMSLPRVFATTFESMPCQVPYLAADPQLVEGWREKLSPRDNFQIAIAWQCGIRHRGDQFRSFPLSSFQPLSEIPGVELVSVQQVSSIDQSQAGQLSCPLREFGETLDRQHGAFMDTAAIMQCADLVVTLDTSVAHLAGALGVPTWVVLPYSPDWRWFRQREDSPWYPTMRLFRQEAIGDWSGAFRRMAASLRPLVERHFAAQDNGPQT